MEIYCFVFPFYLFLPQELMGPGCARRGNCHTIAWRLIYCIWYCVLLQLIFHSDFVPLFYGINVGRRTRIDKKSLFQDKTWAGFTKFASSFSMEALRERLCRHFPEKVRILTSKFTFNVGRKVVWCNPFVSWHITDPIFPCSPSYSQSDISKINA